MHHTENVVLSTLKFYKSNMIEYCSHPQQRMLNSKQTPTLQKIYSMIVPTFWGHDHACCFSFRFLILLISGLLHHTWHISHRFLFSLDMLVSTVDLCSLLLEEETRKKVKQLLKNKIQQDLFPNPNLR